MKHTVGNEMSNQPKSPRYQYVFRLRFINLSTLFVTLESKKTIDIRASFHYGLDTGWRHRGSAETTPLS